MALSTDKLYLIRTGSQAVALIPAKDLRDAINKYITKIGFASPRAYFYNRLMTNIFTTNTGTNHIKECCFITAITGTISGNFAWISSELVVNYGDAFSLVDLRDINNPLFVRPTIKEAHNCDGFDREPEYKLKKFCI